MVIGFVSPFCFLKPQNMHTTLIRNWGFEALVALDWDDDRPGSWGSCDGPDSWKVTSERFFGLQNAE